MRSSYRPEDARDLFGGYQGCWWIAGGWAIDLFLGKETRSHDDLDIAILRRDQLAVRTFLAGWEMRVGYGEGQLAPHPWLGSVPVSRDAPAIWGRDSETADWAFELLLSDATDDEWEFRRDRSIRLPIRQIGTTSREGINILRPEIVLLFKAKHETDTNDADLLHTLPSMTTDSKLWLRTTIEKVHLGHRWLTEIR